jgi:predicted RNA-binding Zn ribbon-like protein
MMVDRLPLNEGPLAVRLVNTWPSDRPGRDLLSTAGQLAAWLDQQGSLLDPACRTALVAEPQIALKQVREVREQVRRLLDARADVQPLPGEDVREMNGLNAAAPSHRELVVAGDKLSVRRRWLTADPTTILLAAVADSCMDVLASPLAVRRCQGPGCRLLFVGGHPRRIWCDSTTCGNRVRVARHGRPHHVS